MFEGAVVFVHGQKSFNLSHKLKLGILLFSVVSLVVSFLLVGTLVRTIVYDNVLESTYQVRMTQAQQVDAWFQAANHIVSNLAQTLPFASSVYYQDIVTHFLNQYDFVESVWVALADGSFYDSAKWVPPYWFVNQERPWWELSAGQSGENVITLPYKSAETEEIIITISRHVQDFNGQEGVVALNVEIQQLEAMITGFQLDDEGYLLLISTDGEVIFHPHYAYLPTFDGLQHMSALRYADVFAGFQAGYSVVYGVCKHGVNSYFMQFLLPSVNWIFVAIVPTAVASTPVWQILSAVMLAIFIALTIMAGLSFIFISRSVAREKKYQQQVEEQTLLMLETVPTSAILYDKDINPVDCNSVTLALHGVATKAEFLHLFTHLAPRSQAEGITSVETIKHHVQETKKKGYSFMPDYTCYRADGTPFSVEATFVRTLFKGEFAVIEYARDLTAQRQALALEQDLKMNVRIQHVMNAGPVCITWYSAERVLIDCNEEALRLFKIEKKEDFLGAFNDRFHEFFPEYQPNGKATMDEIDVYFNEVEKQGRARFEFLQLTSDGEELPTEVTLIRVDSDDSFFFVSFLVDLREIKRAEQARLEAVEENNRAKSRFLARMSHEIRTPIAAVLGIAEIQLRKQELLPPTEDAFTKIYNSAKTLLHIVNDILDFSKIESGKMPLSHKAYNIASLVSDVSQLHFIYMEQKKASFHIHVDENLPSILIGDALRIRQIINNLLTNAFKYTESGTITLKVYCENAQPPHTTLVVTIQDTGLGMSETQLNKIKNNDYVRLHENEKPFVSGTGLGLPIVHNLVQMMGADLSLESEVGVGTLATLRIPQEIGNARPIGQEMAENLQNFMVSKLSLPDELTFIPEQMPHGRMLVVDDVETNLHVAEAMLSFFGLTIDLCDNGFDAIAKINAGHTYDVIFMDHMMPHKDGIEVTAELRALGYTQPIVALTANAVKGQEEIFMQSGFSGFMSKPIDMKMLNSYLVRFVKNKAPAREVD